MAREARCRRAGLWLSLLLFFTVFIAPHANAWFDAAWPFRREFVVPWEADRAAGTELATADVYTAGHHKPDGSDVRVATDDGRVVPSRVLGVGPGDLVRVVFSLVKGHQKYHVYFGNQASPAKPKGTEEVIYHAGLLLEMRALPPGPITTAEQLIASFEKAKTPIGNTMVPNLFIGRNPFGEEQQWISRFTGGIFAPIAGEYTFAISADDRGLLMLDGKPLVFAPNNTGDVRYNARIQLTRGWHEVTAYHANLAGEGQISIGWSRPDSPQFAVIAKEYFGHLYRANSGPLEEIRKTLTADFRVEYLGEAFYAGHYSNRYRFTVNAPKTIPPTYQWDLGDGQVAEGNSVDHVYLTDGVYPIRLTARIGANSDTQTTQFPAHRDYEAEKTQIDEPPVQSKIVEGYNLEKLPAVQLPWAVLLHERAQKTDPMLAAAAKLVITPSGYDAPAGLQALHDATQAALAANRLAEMLKIWDSVPANSILEPAAAQSYARLLVWRAADFDKACKILAPLQSSKNADISRLYGQGLILNNRPEEGKKILELLAPLGPADRQAAISGAIARTIEFYISQSDPETGEKWWDKWQQQYPAQFEEGYSLLLRVKLMEERKAPVEAAKVAEAFAKSIPHSSYAPTLLDYASRLLVNINPAKSSELRKTLKEKYPEDPLNQDKK